MDAGVEINQYTVVEHIGRGGMADVWSARDTRLNRMVAIKTIAHGLTQEADPVTLFKQEAQTIAQMEHPHILPIYDFGDYEGQLYIVMRYVAGGSLEDILRRGPLPINEALRLGTAIAQALDYAHSSKVVHLDLKPPNVLLDSHRSPYLADFGLAAVLDREGKATNPGSGTLLYMAPEQLTAEVIDHRADIYSFAIVMFHMLVGELPFEAATPLALKQLQYHEELPPVDDLNPVLPAHFNDVLRMGTAVNPEDRPETLMALVENLHHALESVTGFAMGMDVAMPGGDDMAYDDFSMGADIDSDDMALLEAVDIYSRARHNWAGGNGRFLLGVTHFMLMNGYYMNAGDHGLELDEAGKQVLLRGALEYDYEVDYWWSQLDDDNRRWVCLHALRSGNAPARVRALYRLETLPDAEKPQIPRLVAQALQIETNAEARLAALQVLGTRARLMRRAQEFDIKTEYRGRMLTSLTRLGIQVSTPEEDWQEIVYTPEIDLLIAENALHYGMPQVAEFAARTVGRIRSKTAVRYIAEQQAEGRRGALRALALVRDEAPTLPPLVNAQGRFYAWGANTLRRMFDRPLSLVFRFLAALVGGWLAMGFYIWATFRTEAIFTPQRWGNSIAIGLVFGVFTAFMVLFAGEFSARLRGFWPWWVRLIVASLLGFFLATLTWGQFTWFYLLFPPDWDVMRFGGLGLAFGFVITGLVGLRSWVAIPLTALATYIPIVTGWHYFFYNSPSLPLTQAPLIYADRTEQIYQFGIPFVLMLAIGGYLPLLVRDLGGLWSRLWRGSSARREAATLPTVVPNVAGRADVAQPQPGAEGPPADDFAPVLEGAPQNLDTELDVNLGRGPDWDDDEVDDEAELYDDAADAASRYTGDETEIDHSQGRTAFDSQPPTEPKAGPDGSRRVNIGTGIRVNTGPADESESDDGKSGPSDEADDENRG